MDTVLYIEAGHSQQSPQGFIELLATKKEIELAEKLAEPLDGPFASTFRGLAKELGISILFTMHLEQGGRSNSAVLVDETGEIRGVYKKTHLFDAFGFSESKAFKRGGEVVVVDWKNVKVGLAICFDIRFPELFRIMRSLGCQLVLIPSGFLAGPGKADQWAALVKARAYENNFFVVAVDQPGPHFVGKSLAVSPLGKEAAALGEGEETAVTEIDISEVAEAREKVPTHRLARFDLYRKHEPYRRTRR